MTLAETARLPRITLGRRLMLARLEAGLDQAVIAKACGVSRQLVSRWERDLSEPHLSEVAKVAEVTGVDYAWLTRLSSSMYKYTPEARHLSSVPAPKTTKKAVAAKKTLVKTVAKATSRSLASDSDVR